MLQVAEFKVGYYDRAQGRMLVIELMGGYRSQSSGQDTGDRDKPQSENLETRSLQD